MNDEEKRLKKNEYQRNLREKNKLKSIVIKPDLVIDTDTTPLKRKPKKAKKDLTDLLEEVQEEEEEDNIDGLTELQLKVAKCLGLIAK